MRTSLRPSRATVPIVLTMAVAMVTDPTVPIPLIVNVGKRKKTRIPQTGFVFFSLVEPTRGLGYTIGSEMPQIFW